MKSKLGITGEKAKTNGTCTFNGNIHFKCRKQFLLFKLLNELKSPRHIVDLVECVVHERLNLGLCGGREEIKTKRYKKPSSIITIQ